MGTMATLKTQPTDQTVEAFLAAVPDPARRADAQALCACMTRITGEPPQMWGTAIVGFGTYHYVYASGREGDWFKVGFSPRKGELVLYLRTPLESQGELLARLGKHKTGKGCLYLKRMSDADSEVLEALIRASL